MKEQKVGVRQRVVRLPLVLVRDGQPRHLVVVLIKLLLRVIRRHENDLERDSLGLHRVVSLYELGSKSSTRSQQSS